MSRRFAANPNSLSLVSLSMSRVARCCSWCSSRWCSTLLRQFGQFVYLGYEEAVNKLEPARQDAAGDMVAAFASWTALAQRAAETGRARSTSAGGRTAEHQPVVVTLKLAMDRQGAVDDLSNSSYRFTSPESLDAVHRLRRASDAVLVGVNTVIRDDPSLTVRRVPLVPGAAQPLRVVLDRRRDTLSARGVTRSSLTPVLRAAAGCLPSELKALEHGFRTLVVASADADVTRRSPRDSRARSRTAPPRSSACVAERGGRTAGPRFTMFCERSRTAA